MSTNVNAINQERLMLHIQEMLHAAPVKRPVLESKKSTTTASDDPWAGGAMTGCGGFLLRMAYTETNLLGQMGALQNEQTMKSTSLWQKMMSEAADEQQKLMNLFEIDIREFLLLRSCSRCDRGRKRNSDNR